MTGNRRARFNNWLHDELLGEQPLSGLLGGSLMGLTEVFITLSLASLIFSGPLATYLPQGLGAALMAAAVIMILSSLISSMPGLIASVQDSSSVLLAVIAARLASQVSAGEAHNALPTVLVAIAIATLSTGAFLLAMGVFKLGGLVRYIPYPVVGGFLAGTGLLLAQGSIGAMADYPLTASNLPALLQSGQIILWLPGVIFAAVLFLGLRYIKHSLAMPGLLIGMLLVFYLVLSVSGIPVERASQMGLLLGQVGAAQWKPPSLTLLLDADWRAILGQAGNIAVLVTITMISLLLNATGMELALKRDMDLNQELRAIGIANLLSGLCGGIVGYHALSLTVLSQRIGGRARLSGIASGLAVGAVLFAGASLLGYFPKAMLGGMLLFLGADFLIEWVIHGWRRFTRAEYAVVLLIMVVIAASDFLVGVGLGLAVMVVMFVVRYSRINVVHRALSGREIHSHVERPASLRRALAQRGDQIYILALQGYIFFGTANALLEQVRRRVNDPHSAPPRFTVLDFRRVSGLDSSAALSFAKIRQLAEARQITLLLTGARPEILGNLQLPAGTSDDPTVRIFPDIDRGLEWCEKQILALEGLAAALQPKNLAEQLAEESLPEPLVSRLMNYLEPIQLAAGEYLIHQDDPADDMYYIESGRLTVYLEAASEKRVRLRTLQSGSSVGEMGLYLGQRRVASVVAEETTRAYRLSRQALEEMKAQDPELAAAFHEMIARLLSEILTLATQIIEAMDK
ncbi:MAG: SLC26A/SulP transporter family protein [Anaerolineales bacterium]|nr:SLC26A/SulP transporter family protein [Anaerolineales bacterium]